MGVSRTLQGKDNILSSPVPVAVFPLSQDQLTDFMGSLSLSAERGPSDSLM